MNRPFLILAVVAVLFAGAALLATKNRAALTAADTTAAEGALFPVLETRVNDVTEVTVTGSEGAFTLKREDDTWGATEKGGYPIDFGKVKALVVGVSQFDVVEAKTANPAYHDRLGLEGPSAAPEAGDAADAQVGAAATGSESKRVTLKDDAGTVLADVIVGDARPSRSGQATLYARRADEDQSYEVTGRLSIDTTPSNWLDRKVLELKQETVASVTIAHPDGERLVISRGDPEEANFTVADVPAERELVWEGVARSIATAAQSLNLDDVGGEDLFDFDAAEVTVTEFRTFDGLVVTTTTAEQDDKTYLRVAARAEPVAVPEEPEEPEVEGADEEALAEVEAEEPQRSFEEVSAEADAINARVAGWVYVIPGWSATNLRKRMDELLKPLEPETPPVPEDAPLDLGDQELPEGLEQAIQEALSGGDGGG